MTCIYFLMNIQCYILYFIVLLDYDTNFTPKINNLKSK